MDLIEQFAARHPSDHIRFHALKARAAVAGDLDARIALFEQATRSTNRYVATMARQEVEKLEVGRAWLAGSGLAAAQ